MTSLYLFQQVYGQAWTVSANAHACQRLKYERGRHSPSGLSPSAKRQYGGGGDSETRKKNKELIRMASVFREIRKLDFSFDLLTLDVLVIYNYIFIVINYILYIYYIYLFITINYTCNEVSDPFMS